MKLEDSQPTHLIPVRPNSFPYPFLQPALPCFPYETLLIHNPSPSLLSPAAAREVCDEGRGGPLLGGVCGDEDEGSGQDLNKRQGLALLTKVGESVKHVAGGYKLRARPAEFCAMGEYLDTFSQKLGTIDRIAQRILREQSEYLTELREYGAVYSSWAASEEQLQRPLEGVAGCVTTSCGALEDLSDNMSQDFLPVLREYVLYIESMKNVLRKRDQVQAEYEGRLEAAVLHKQEDRTPVSNILPLISLNFISVSLECLL
ncbi:hypothetical protein XENOCAPTIV_001934 [Xenoophorus captivus]|uniref:Uncharacterized protein n=1 Tax=Xenoophorus captivus TaxID=1517983 RepID=A0ABV0Q880_9TELE